MGPLAIIFTVAAEDLGRFRGTKKILDHRDLFHRVQRLARQLGLDRIGRRRWQSGQPRSYRPDWTSVDRQAWWPLSLFWVGRGIDGVDGRVVAAMRASRAGPSGTYPNRVRRRCLRRSWRRRCLPSRRLVGRSRLLRVRRRRFLPWYRGSRRLSVSRRLSGLRRMSAFDQRFQALTLFSGPTIATCPARDGVDVMMPTTLASWMLGLDPCVPPMGNGRLERVEPRRRRCTARVHISLHIGVVGLRRSGQHAVRRRRDEWSEVASGGSLTLLLIPANVSRLSVCCPGGDRRPGWAVGVHSPAAALRRCFSFRWLITWFGGSPCGVPTVISVVLLLEAQRCVCI